MTLSIAEAHRALTAPGAPFEMDEVEIRGVATRVWKNTPPDLRAVLARSGGFAERDFLVYQGERLTHGQHFAAVARLAHLLVDAYGVRKGERVAIAMRNYTDWSVAFFAAAAIGAVVVPLNAWWTGPELEYGLADSGSVVLIADDERAVRILPHLPALEVRGALVVRGDAPAPFRRLEELLAARPPVEAPPEVAIDPEDEATIFYTSGTTGFPKGALGTHRNICTNLVNIAFGQARALLRRGDPLPDPAEPPAARGVLLAVPFFHATGCHSILAITAWMGGKVVLMRKWDPEEALALIERERVTSFGGVPAIAWQVLESARFGDHDLSSVESIGYGGAPAAPELVANIRAKMPAAAPGNGYGLTETSSVTTQNLAEDYIRKPDSVGLAAAVCDLKVVDEDGAELPEGEVGELWIKGPNVVKGYWNKPEATAETFTDGWLHSGDLARIDEEGFVYIVDRAKDMLIRGGENVYCVEVENALNGHAAVMDAAVVGLPHRVLGEEVGAVVQVTPGADVSEQALQDHVAKQLAAVKVPARIELRAEPLPRNANGKVLKTQLRDEMTG